MKSPTKKVIVYDIETKQATEIPASELAPDMVAIELPDVGLVFIPASDSERVTVLSPPFASPELERIARTVFSLLPRFMTEEEFVNGLRTDGSPVGELKEWMIMAALYHDLSPPRPEDAERIGPALLHVILAVRNNGEHALQTVDYSVVAEDLAEFIITRARAFTEEDLDSFWRSRIDLETFRRLEAEEDARQS